MQQFLFQPFALPNSIVGVLNRQLGQKRWRLRRETFIKRRQLAYQDAQRPAVADDVMSGGKNYVFSFGESHHFHAQQWTMLILILLLVSGVLGSVLQGPFLLLQTLVLQIAGVTGG